jgi:protein phosphatase
VLHRETEDHSIVEEEVRAGRMTPEQAANHPSKNVISRALGAEQGVEVDMKTIEVEDGTEFLLCTDGITRHITDNEMRQLLVVSSSLEDVCNELKRRCYERGAEDNLTVVVVRVGERLSSEDRLGDLEPTLTPETQYATQPNGQPATVVAADQGNFVPASRIAFPGPTPGDGPLAHERLNVADPAVTASGGSGATKLLGALLVVLLVAGAFYAGARYKERIPFLASKAQPAVTTPVNTPTPVPEEPFVKFERARRQVDQDPRAWLQTDTGKELVNAGVQNPLQSPNAEFLYLYGRANLLTGNTEEASKAFDAAISKADAAPSPASATIKKEAILGLAALSFKTQRDRWKTLNQYEELTKPPASVTAP